MISTYPPAARERRIPEAAKASSRSDFERDRARVLHSSAFRRLADKTQVVVPGEDDFPRTRLTHSLEVAQIAREMGACLGCDPDVVDAAGLAHDLGHPPFGHNGEEALHAVCADIGGFEGNAQTLRILTRLEPKVLTADGHPGGLNLTRAALDATIKYPWPVRAGVRKFGVYADDRPAFDWARTGAAGERRCLEAQVMDWADDVAYSVHDVEDGVQSRQIVLDAVDDAEREALCLVAAELYSPRSPLELAPALERLLALPAVAGLCGFDGSLRALVRAKQATSELTGRFAQAAARATRAEYGDQPLTRYDADLIVPPSVADEVALLKALAAKYVMRRPGAEQLRGAQRVLLTELVEVLDEAGREQLDPVQRAAWDVAASPAERRRVVIDQVAQLTDSSATAWHDRLVRRRD